jgi:D-3-phosphoglycerate dehydrogenase
VGELYQVLGQADALIVAAALTEETRGMIDAAALALLPRGAIVANFARGGIIEETALQAALAAGTLQGALLDVYSKEPLAADHPLRTNDKALLTPHLGASTAEGQRNVAVDVCIAVRDALLEGELSGAVNLAGVDHGRWRDLRGGLSLARQATSIARAARQSRRARHRSGDAPRRAAVRGRRESADGVGGGGRARTDHGRGPHQPDQRARAPANEASRSRWCRCSPPRTST